MLASGEFKGNVYAKHMQIQGVEIAHFRSWLGLCEPPVRRLSGPGVAEEFMVVAWRIAASLQDGYCDRAETM